MTTGKLKAIAAKEAEAAAARQRKLRIVGALAGVAVLAGVGVTVLRRPDPMSGPRPAVADVAALPRVMAAYKAFRVKHGRAPSPEQLASALKKDRQLGRVPAIVGASGKAPHAFRLAGTVDAPSLEVLDERGEVALYGESPLVVKLEAL